MASSMTDKVIECKACGKYFVICEGHMYQDPNFRSKKKQIRQKQMKEPKQKTEPSYSVKLLRSFLAPRTWVVSPDVRKTYQTLDLRKSKLKTIPANSTLLNQLQALRLNNNESLEDVSLIGQLKELRVLVLKSCDVKKFSSTGITESLLLALELGNNPNLNDFADIRLLYRLQYLNIGGCQLRKMPEEVLHLRRLRVLVLDDNPFEVIVSDFSYLEKLQVLLMKNCNLCEIPSNVFGIQQLKYLSIEQNNISMVPSTVVKLVGLEVLNIYGNRGIRISNKTSKCLSLKRINVDLNFSLKSLPKKLKKLIKVWTDAPSIWWKQIN
ncbi:unnamed protein product [Clavelina lepadiformis]|uniref:Uncharacterized protein n=1 Tax=Clavelina lepadiformis TaxID=159417 RepID=A0ABP0FV29_CLALP